VKQGGVEQGINILGIVILWPKSMKIYHQPQAHDTLKVKFSHTRYRALGPELIPVYRQSARR